MVRRILLYLLLVLGLSACEKEPEVVYGNYPPADPTLTEAEYRQYVNRCYIQVHGTEPDSSELAQTMNELQQAGFSSAARMKFLDTLFSKQAYKWQVFNTTRQDILNNTDTVEMRNQLVLFTLLLTDSSYILVWPVLQYEVNRFQELIDAGPAYASGSIDIRELHRRFINNWFYDQINMGSANFVTVSFQQFLNRNPVAQELASGVSMVDGNFSSLFLQGGSSKDDYLNIFFNSAGYEEGAVVKCYRRYLSRDPDSQEMSAATIKFGQSNDYEQIQKDILVTDEYAAL